MCSTGAVWMKCCEMPAALGTVEHRRRSVADCRAPGRASNNVIQMVDQPDDERGPDSRPAGRPSPRRLWSLVARRSF